MTNKFKAIIVDDETNARLSLRGILDEFFPEIYVADEAKDVPSAVKMIHQHKPDVIFLDIEMPGYSGLSLLDFFNKDNIDFKIVFVTAYSEYAINAFELSAIDYILKPIRKEELERVVKKLNINQHQSLTALKDNLNSNDKKIAINTSDALMFVKPDDIIYLKADGSYTHIYLINQPKVTVTKRINEFERLESVGRFMRIHRSHIVNLNHISKILKQDGGAVLMSNDDTLSISAEKKQHLLSTIEDDRF